MNFNLKNCFAGLLAGTMLCACGVQAAHESFGSDEETTSTEAVSPEERARRHKINLSLTRELNQQRVDKMQKKIDSLEGENLLLKGERNADSVKINARSQETERLSQELAKNYETIQQEKARIAALEGEAELLKNEVSRLLVKLSGERNRLKQAIRENGNLKNKIVRLEAFNDAPIYED